MIIQDLHTVMMPNGQPAKSGEAVSISEQFGHFLKNETCEATANTVVGDEETMVEGNPLTSFQVALPAAQTSPKFSFPETTALRTAGADIGHADSTLDVKMADALAAQTTEPLDQAPNHQRVILPDNCLPTLAQNVAEKDLPPFRWKLEGATPVQKKIPTLDTAVATKLTAEGAPFSGGTAETVTNIIRSDPPQPEARVTTPPGDKPAEPTGLPLLKSNAQSNNHPAPPLNAVGGQRTDETIHAKTIDAKPGDPISYELPKRTTETVSAPPLRQAVSIPALTQFIAPLVDAQTTIEPLENFRTDFPTAQQLHSIPNGPMPTIPDTYGPRIIQMIAEAAKAMPDRPVELTLNPQELGRVRMVLHATESSMNVVLAVERPETTELLRRHIDSLAHEFRALGYGDVAFEFAGQNKGDGKADTHVENHASRDLAEQVVDPTPQPLSLNLTPTDGVDLRL